MEEFTLTIIDVTGIQNYIFGSNRLRENIGASYLVEQATGQWIADALPTSHNLIIDRRMCKIDDNCPQLENDKNQQAEVIYRGGGNVVILFRTHDAAIQTIRTLSTRIVEEAPGLEIAAAHITFKWQQQALGGSQGIYNQMMMQKLRHYKQQRQPATPLLGQSVMASCRSTGLPAIGFDPDDTERPVSAEVWAKVQPITLKHADERFEDFLPDQARTAYEISRDLDHLGRSVGESSYIAIVHADGNDIGGRFRQIILRYTQPEQNRTCLNELRHFSIALEKAGNAALYQTVERMLHTFANPIADQMSDHMRRFLTSLDTSHTTGKPYLPFRPLVFGGDDVTFVCDGRLGLTLAQFYLTAFEQAANALPDGSGDSPPATASAGVAIVKTHYPFYRAYKLCSELCTNAKRALYEADRKDTSAMDWHFAASGLSGNLKEIRQREYQVQEGELYMRPVVLSGSGLDGWRSWKTYAGLVETFNWEELWQGRHNKVIALREALRKGRTTTERFRTTYNISRLPDLGSSDVNAETSGWAGNRCGYFDAIEAMDFYLPLAEQKEPT